jgi:hypothetical protein
MVWVKGELLDDFAEAARLGSAQLDRANQASLFDRLSWFERVWKHTPPGKSLLIARAQRDRAFVWLFLALPSPHQAVGLSNWYSFHTGPVFVGEAGEADRVAMLIAIARRLAPGLTRFTVAPVRSEDSNLLKRAFNRAGWSVFEGQSSTRWTANVAAKTFQDYWAERPSQLRNTFKRKSSKSGIKCTIHTKFSAAAWEDYEAVYAGSWKPEEGSPTFLREMAEDEANAGNLRLAIAKLNGKPVAAQLWTVEGGIALIHKLAYLSELRDLSPGTVLSEAIFRHVIDQDKVDLIDFGTGDDGYKADWMDQSEPLYELRFFNNKSAGGLLGAARAKLAALAGR